MPCNNEEDLGFLKKDLATRLIPHYLEEETFLLNVLENEIEIVIPVDDDDDDDSFDDSSDDSSFEFDSDDVIPGFILPTLPTFSDSSESFSSSIYEMSPGADSKSSDDEEKSYEEQVSGEEDRTPEEEEKMFEGEEQTSSEEMKTSGTEETSPEPNNQNSDEEQKTNKESLPSDKLEVFKVEENTGKEMKISVTEEKVIEKQIIGKKINISVNDEKSGEVKSQFSVEEKVLQKYVFNEGMENPEIQNIYETYTTEEDTNILELEEKFKKQSIKKKAEILETRKEIIAINEKISKEEINVKSFEGQIKQDEINTVIKEKDSEEQISGDGKKIPSKKENLPENKH